MVIQVLLSYSILCQTVYEFDSVQSNMIIYGASNLKKWDAAVPIFDGSFSMNATADTAMNIQFSCHSAAIDGGHGPDMNNKIKAALKSESHPNILFQSEYVTLTGANFMGIGLLEIGGVQAPVEITGTIENQSITGSAVLNLSLFSIEPPTAMFGSIVCKDEIRVEWIVRYREKTN